MVYISNLHVDLSSLTLNIKDPSFAIKNESFIFITSISYSNDIAIK